MLNQLEDEKKFTEQDMVELIKEVLESSEETPCAFSTFLESGILTPSNGFVVRMNGSKFQVTIKEVK